MAKNKDIENQTTNSTTQPEELQNALSAKAAPATPAAHPDDATVTQSLDESAQNVANAADPQNTDRAETPTGREPTDLSTADVSTADGKPAFFRRKWVMVTAPIVAGVLLLGIGGSIGYALGDGPGDRGGDRSSRFAQSEDGFDGRGGFGGLSGENGHGGKGGGMGGHKYGGPGSGTFGGDPSQGQAAPDSQQPHRPGQIDSNADSNSGQVSPDKSQSDRSTRDSVDKGAGNNESNAESKNSSGGASLAG